MRDRGSPVRCHTCRTVSRRIDGAFWACARCGGVTFTIDDPAFRDHNDWWEKFNDTIGADRYLREAVAIALQQKRDRIANLLRRRPTKRRELTGVR